MLIPVALSTNSCVDTVQHHSKSEQLHLLDITKGAARLPNNCLNISMNSVRPPSVTSTSGSCATIGDTLGGARSKLPLELPTTSSSSADFWFMNNLVSCFQVNKQYKTIVHVFSRTYRKVMSSIT